jgi:GDPmannose 4,6-dehydratase
VQIAFDHVGLDWRQHVVVDPQFYRPAEVDVLLANPAKARQRLGWQPAVSFEQLVKLMVDADITAVGGPQAAANRTRDKAA